MGYDDKGRALRFIRGSDAWNGPDDYDEFARIFEEDVDRLVEMFAEVRADERRLAKASPGVREPTVLILGTRNDAGTRFKVTLMRQRRAR